MDRAGTMFCVPGERAAIFSPTKMVANGPLHPGRATDAINREVKVFSDALKAADGAEEAFVCVFAPGWLDHHIVNEHYATDEAFMFAVADAMRTNTAPSSMPASFCRSTTRHLPDLWDMIEPEPSIAEYRKRAEPRVERINHALARHSGGPRALSHLLGQLAWRRTRTTCRSSTIVDLAARRCRRRPTSFEAANVAPRARMDGVEGREAAATARSSSPGSSAMPPTSSSIRSWSRRRIKNFAGVVGRENVIAGTDCGLGYRVHPQIGLGEAADARRRRAARVEGAVGTLTDRH